VSARRPGDKEPATEDNQSAEGVLGARGASITLALSSDGGVTWDIVGNLDESDGYCLTNNSRDGLNREFS